jgi:hypothetical protein
MRIGYATGYWKQGPPAGALKAIRTAERLGYESVWTAEAYGSDAFTPLAWWGSQTKRVRLGTGIAQISARTPAATAMAALTISLVAAQYWGSAHPDPRWWRAGTVSRTRSRSPERASMWRSSVTSWRASRR